MANKSISQPTNALQQIGNLLGGVQVSIAPGSPLDSLRQKIGGFMSNFKSQPTRQTVYFKPPPAQPAQISPVTNSMAVAKSIAKRISPTVTPKPPLTGFLSPLASVAPKASPTPTPTATPYGLARNPSISRFLIPNNIQTVVNQAADRYSLPRTLLYDIMLQENGSFDPKRVNTTPEGVAAGNPTGLFQFTDGTWRTVQNYAQMPGSSLQLPNFDRTDPLTNALAAAYLIKHGQLGRWDASKNIWGQFYTPEELQQYYSQTLR